MTELEKGFSFFSFCQTMKSLTTDFFNKGKKKGQRGWMAAKGNFCLWSREREKAIL